MSSKSTPKSCSCGQCARFKSTPAGGLLMKREERAFRRAQNNAVRAGRTDDLTPAGARRPMG